MEKVRVKNLNNGLDIQLDVQNNSIWIDLELPEAATLQKIELNFPFNKLALEDALEKGHWAKFESYQEHIFLIFRTLAEPNNVNDITERVSMFIYPEKNAIITIRNEPVNYLDDVWQEVNNRQSSTIIDIIYALLQRGTDTFFDFLDAIEIKTDILEERVFKNSTRSIINGQKFASKVFELKHAMIHARRLASGARESVGQFARHITYFDPEGAIYLRDVSDHLTRIYDGLDSARDVLTSLLDVHLNVQSNRLNEVMKTLTTVSTIFLPLTFLAGVWGMNFQHQPEFNWLWGYPFAWLVFILIGLSLAIYFKKRGWW